MNAEQEYKIQKKNVPTFYFIYEPVAMAVGLCQENG